MTKDIALVYMVAGISSRFGGKIKQLVEVGPEGESFIEYSLKQALPAGFTKLIFIVGEKTEKPFREIFQYSYQGVPVFYALQTFDPALRDKPWGTADALCAAKELIGCPLVVCNGDDLYGANTFKILVDHLKSSDEAAAPGYKLIDVIPDTGTTNRGIFQTTSNYQVQKITEVLNISKSDLSASGVNPSDSVSMNIFALHPATVNLLSSRLKSFKEKHQGDRKKESLLPEELSDLIENQQLVMKVYPTTDRWFGITNPEDQEKVREQLKKL